MEKVNILLLDNDPIGLEAMLAPLNQKLVWAASTDEALRCVERKDFSVVLIDTHVHGSFETASQIKALKPAIPILFIAPRDIKEADVLRAYSAGGVDVLIKPISAEILRAKLSAFIELFRNRSVLKQQVDHIQQYEENEWFRTALTSIGDAVIVTDSLEQVVFLNPVAEKLTGWSRTDALGKDISTVFNIVNQQTRRPVQNPIARVLATGMIIGLANHTLLIARDGTEIPIDDSGSPIRDNIGNISGAVLVFRDVTEQRRAHQLETQLAAIVRSSDDAIIGKDLNGIVTSWNRGAERMYCYTAEEMIGKSITLLIPPDCPNDVPFILDRIKRGELIEHYETKRMGKDGRVLDVSLTVSPIHDLEGRVVGASKIARDITERKQKELERARSLEREQLARAEAEAAVRSRDEFLSVAAHELRTPVTSLRGFAQTLTRQADHTGTLAPERMLNALTHIDVQSRKLTNLVNQLLDISRIKAGRLTLERKPTDLYILVRDVIELARANTQRHTISLHADSSVRAYVDPLRIEQVITNLIDNAIKYSSDGTIAVTITQLNGDLIQITVADQGIGIPVKRRERLFERFYQAHTDGFANSSGMGLGLYISRQIVELHGGTIEAEFPAEGGTRFVINLPIGL